MTEAPASGVYPLHIDGMTCDPPCEDGPCGDVEPLPAVSFPEQWTPEQIEAFKAEFERSWAERKYEPLKVLPPRPLLTPETARELLRECVTVVRPGEVLVIRTSDGWTAEQVGEVQQYANWWLGYRGLDVSILFLPGEEFAVATAKADGE